MKYSACEKIDHIDMRCLQKHSELKPFKKGISIYKNTHFTFSTAFYIASQVNGFPNYKIFDSNMSEHFTPYQELYSTYEPLSNSAEVRTVNEKLKEISIYSAYLTVKCHAGAQVKVTLEKVLYILGINSNLLSSNTIVANGLNIQMLLIKEINIFKNGRLI